MSRLQNLANNGASILSHLIPAWILSLIWIIRKSKIFKLNNSIDFLLKSLALSWTMNVVKFYKNLARPLKCILLKRLKMLLKQVVFLNKWTLNSYQELFGMPTGHMQDGGHCNMMISCKLAVSQHWHLSIKSTKCSWKLCHFGLKKGFGPIRGNLPMCNSPPRCVFLRLAGYAINSGYALF